MSTHNIMFSWLNKKIIILDLSYLRLLAGHVCLFFMIVETGRKHLKMDSGYRLCWTNSSLQGKSYFDGKPWNMH